MTVDPARATALCTVCPKTCRSSCPVSEATHNEALSAWGKMTLTHHALANGRPIDDDLSAAVHSCTGCMRCTTSCPDQNDVAQTLFAVREKTNALGVAPKGAASTLATFQQSQNPFGRELGSLVSSWRASGPVRHPLFPGCVSLVKRPGLIQETLNVSEAFGAPMGVARSASKCCGYPLYAMGAFETFRAHARAVATTLADTPDLVVLDPGCAMTFRKLYPRFGVHLRTSVLTVIEVLCDNLPHAPELPPLPERIGYHDACHLGRGLGLYDQPRALLAVAVAAVNEASFQRREGGCSGGGGLLPRSLNEISVAMARQCALELVHHQPLAVVSACPTSTRLFERAGHRAYDLVGLLDRWVNQR